MIRKIAIITLVVLCCGACSEEEVLETITMHDDAVVLDVNVAGTTTRTYPLGSTTEQALFAAGDQIKVATATRPNQDDEPDDPSLSDFITYTYNGSTWTSPDDDTYISWTSSSQFFYAYYPVTTANEDYSVWQYDYYIDSDQSTLEKLTSCDAMVLNNGYEPQLNNSRQLSLTLERTTALVTIVIDGYNNQFDEMPTISDLKIYSLYTYNYNSTITHLAVTPYKSTTTIDGTSYDTYSAIVSNAPKTKGYTFLSLTATDSDGTEYALTATPDGYYPLLKAGYSYEYHVTIGKDAVRFNSITVKDMSNYSISTSGAIPSVYFEVSSSNALTTTWLEENITARGMTLYITGNIDRLQSESGYRGVVTTLQSFLSSGGKGADARLTVDLSGLTLTMGIMNSNFGNSTGLEACVLPASGVAGLPTGFFSYCTNLLSVNYENISAIAGSQLHNTAITTLYAPNVSGIGINGCANSKHLETVTLGKVTSFKNGAFGSCTALKSIDISSSTSVPEVYYSESSPATNSFYMSDTWDLSDVDDFTIYVSLDIYDAFCDSLENTNTNWYKNGIRKKHIKVKE